LAAVEFDEAVFLTFSDHEINFDQALVMDDVEG
jgi:hypothetical protein